MWVQLVNHVVSHTTRRNGHSLRALESWTNHSGSDAENKGPVTGQRRLNDEKSQPLEGPLEGARV